MTVFNFTDTTSVLVTAAGTNAFDGDSAGADTLTVAAAAYLIATGSGYSQGAVLAPTGAWKVTVNGVIVSKNSVALLLDIGNTAVSTITIGADGELGGGLFGQGLVIHSAATVKNAGTITGQNAIYVWTPAGTVVSITNTGVIGDGNTPSIVAGGTNEGIVKLTNSGIIDGAISLGYGNDTMKNTGTIRGHVSLGEGNDVFTNTGTVTGEISLGGGNNTFKGGKQAETVRAGTGADNVNLGAGDDTFYGSTGNFADGLDIIDGGAGTDTYIFELLGGVLRINLDKVAHDSPFTPGTQSIAANTAIGTSGATTNTDIVRNFENVTGTPGADIFYGSAAANRLDGSHGSDQLAGFGGNDTLIGGLGSDALHGGVGRDTLWGGEIGGTGDGVTDAFVFTALTDSGKTKAKRDIIMDFEDGLDRILLQIDANTKLAGDQIFTYINGDSSTTPAAMFTKAPGQLRSYLSADGVIIEGDVNGDGKADFSLELRDPNHTIVLTSADFLFL